MLKLDVKTKTATGVDFNSNLTSNTESGQVGGDQYNPVNSFFLICSALVFLDYSSCKTLLTKAETSAENAEIKSLKILKNKVANELSIQSNLFAN